ncbi:MAG: hypothetical protein QNI91_08840 [Arenicellales bacterium]|nr:hypothetical protein [Arenicellales bacterium]
MAKKRLSDQETNQYATLFLLAHRQLAAVQRQLGPGMSFRQRWSFRLRHRRICRLLGTLINLKGGSTEEAEKGIEQDLELINSGKQGWSYVSAGEIEYLKNVLKGL